MTEATLATRAVGDAAGPPAVVYPARVESAALWAWGSWLLVLGGVALAWWRWGAAAPAMLLVYLVLIGAVAAWAWSSAVHQPVGDLIWNGRRWAFALCGGVDHVVWIEQVVRVVDGQSWLLLRADATDRPPFWLLLRRRHAPARWLDLRRALYQP